MTWAEIKRAVEAAGISDDDDILAIECEMHDGDKTMHKAHQGQFVRLVENIKEEYLKEQAAGCCI